jgi:cardiolipin synthase
MKKRGLGPALHPSPGRRIPEVLRPENVGRLAAALPEGLADPRFPELLQRIDEGPILPGNRVRIYFGGAAAFSDMCREIAAARSEILLESYILKDDATGRGFLETLAEAVGRGVSVRVLADFWGSFATRRSFWDEMRRRGIDVRLFNPLFPHLLLQPFRDHRKILVIDRRIAYTGGMNIGDEYGGSGGSVVGGSKKGPWRDTHAQVEGPTAWEMAIVFNEAWRRAGGEPLALEPLTRVSPGGASILTLDSRPGRGHGETASALAAILAAAQKRLWITNAYFAPRRELVDVLGAAVRRGVDVRVLLPGPTDVPLVRHAGHGYFRGLLEGGVRVFEYGSAILHAKTLVADDNVSVVGSTNLDFRSFHFNAECNLVIFHEPTARAFVNAFREDLTRAGEITPGDWRRRRPGHALADSAAKLLAPLL